MKHKIPQRKNIFEALYTKISKPISTILVKTSLTPNQITIISGILGILGAYYLTCHSRIYLIYAAVSIQLFTILDLVDGDIARMKDMQSHFGKWLDVFFDKLNDFLIILGLSVGIYWRTNNISALYLGILLMGLVFFIQFSMVINSIIFSESKTNSNSNFKNSFQGKIKINKKISLINKVRRFIGKHLLLEHCAFLFIVSFFSIINRTEFGLWFLTLHALSTIFYITITSYYKIKHL